MNYNDVTIGIVTFKSEKVIFNCLKSIKNIKKIIIFDNSNDIELKHKILKKYPKIQFIVSKKNLGYGGGNNQILKKSKTKYFFLLSPDTILKKKCEQELMKKINKIKDFSLIAPFAKEKNFGFFQENNENKKNKNKNVLEVDYVKGFAMLFNTKKIKKFKMFDENIFLYLEEIDLCKRVKDEKGRIILINAELTHEVGFSHGKRDDFEMEKSRNWHWMWSKFYYSKKHKGYIYGFIITLPNFFSAIFKFIFYSLINRKKKEIYKMRILGLLNSYLKKRSFYRPYTNN